MNREPKNTIYDYDEHNGQFVAWEPGVWDMKQFSPGWSRCMAIMEYYGFSRTAWDLCDWEYMAIWDSIIMLLKHKSGYWLVHKNGQREHLPFKRVVLLNDGRIQCDNVTYENKFIPRKTRNLNCH